MCGVTRSAGILAGTLSRPRVQRLLSAGQSNAAAEAFVDACYASLDYRIQ
jgi:hypothetical protein